MLPSLPSAGAKCLEDFPFDTLKCTLEYGSWIRTELYIRPLGMDGRCTVGGSDTLGDVFPQFTLEEVVLEEKIYAPYAATPEEDSHILQYHLAFSRA